RSPARGHNHRKPVGEAGSNRSRATRRPSRRSAAVDDETFPRRDAHEPALHVDRIAAAHTKRVEASQGQANAERNIAALRAQQRPQLAAHLQIHRVGEHVVDGSEGSRVRVDALTYRQRLDRHHQTQAIAATNFCASDTQPKMPPWALIISSPTRWNSGKYDATQSLSTTHSKPRSFASRTVVCTHTSSVT